MPCLLHCDALHPQEIRVALRMKGPEEEEGEQQGEAQPVPLALFLQLLGWAQVCIAWLAPLDHVKDGECTEAAWAARDHTFSLNRTSCIHSMTLLFLPKPCLRCLPSIGRVSITTDPFMTWKNCMWPACYNPEGLSCHCYHFEAAAQLQLYFLSSPGI